MREIFCRESKSAEISEFAIGNGTSPECAACGCEKQHPHRSFLDVSRVCVRDGRTNKGLVSSEGLHQLLDRHHYVVKNDNRAGGAERSLCPADEPLVQSRMLRNALRTPHPECRRNPFIELNVFVHSGGTRERPNMLLDRQGKRGFIGIPFGFTRYRVKWKNTRRPFAREKGGLEASRLKARSAYEGI